ncbi:MAG: hypothetical protein ABSG94_05930, partial [Brevinematales bacterium]
MAEQNNKINSLSAQAAYQLANVTKTVAQFDSITPRWLTKMLEWKPLETGIFRLNKVKEGDTPLDVLCSGEVSKDIPEGFVDYEAKPREYILYSISTILRVNTKVSDIYSSPYDQIKEQLRLTIESIKERQESQLVNNDDYGLLKNVHDSQKLQCRSGFPTPDDMDDLIAKVWKEPSFFLAHPTA